MDSVTRYEVRQEIQKFVRSSEFKGIIQENSQPRAASNTNMPGVSIASHYYPATSYNGPWAWHNTRYDSGGYVSNGKIVIPPDGGGHYFIFTQIYMTGASAPPYSASVYSDVDLVIVSGNPSSPYPIITPRSFSTSASTLLDQNHVAFEYLYPGDSVYLSGGGMVNPTANGGWICTEDKNHLTVLRFPFGIQ